MPSLRDSDAMNQGLEALILAQAVEYRLNFEVDHDVIAFLKTLLQPFERALSRRWRKAARKDIGGVR
jgi:hypothetical protein